MARERMPSEKRIKAAAAELQALVSAYCLELGGIRVDMGSGGIAVPTRYGPLIVWEVHESEWLSVFARFMAPERARPHTDCNPYTGKWNYHGDSIREGATPSAVFAAWKYQMARIYGGDLPEVRQALDKRNLHWETMRAESVGAK